MIRNISKICSFLLLFLISVLSLNKLSIMSYSETLKNIFYFLTLVLITFSSVTTLLTNKSGFLKFVGGVIITALICGGILAIIKPGVYIGLYACIILTAIFCLVDMFYKPS